MEGYIYALVIPLPVSIQLYSVHELGTWTLAK